MTHQCNQLHSSHSGPFGHISLSLLLLTSPCSLVPQTLRLLHPLTNNTATLSASLLATRLDFKARIHNDLALGISYIYRPMYAPVDRIIIDPTSLSRSEARPYSDSGPITHTSFLVTSPLSLGSTPFHFELASLVVAAQNAVPFLQDYQYQMGLNTLVSHLSKQVTCDL